MSGFREEDLPRPTYELSENALLSAFIVGGPQSGQGFQKLKGHQIQSSNSLRSSIYLDDHEEYLVVSNSKIIPERQHLILNHNGYKYSRIIFYKCSLPGLVFENTEAESLFFVNCKLEDIYVNSSKLEDIRITENSKASQLRITNKAEIRHVYIYNNSTTRGIDLQENSLITNIKIFEKSDCGIISITNSRQDGNIEIYDNSYNGDINIKNSHTGKIILRGGSRFRELKIDERSEVLSALIQEDSRSGKIWLNEKSNIGGFTVNSNSKNDGFFLTDDSKCDNIYIYNNSECSSIKLDDSLVLDIKVESNSIIGDIGLHRGSESQTIRISNNCTIGIIWVDNRSFNSGLIHIHDSCKCTGLKITHESYCYSIEISRDNEIGFIEVNGKSFIQGLNVLFSTVKLLIMKGYSDQIFLRDTWIKLARIEECQINSLRWDAGSKGEFYFTKCSINHLELKTTSLAKDAIMLFSHTSFFISHFQEFITLGQTVFINIKPLIPNLNDYPIIENTIGRDVENLMNINQSLRTNFQNRITDLIQKYGSQPRFILADSSMGKTEITGSELTGFQFEYRDTKMLEMFISGTKLPKEHIKIFSHEEIEKQSIPQDEQEQKVSVYNQLRKIMEGTGNIVEATWYHAKAMEHQGKLLKAEAKKNGRFSNEAIELWNFRLNKISNNHGESWARAILFVLALTVIFYTPYFILLHYKQSFSFSGTEYFIGGFFQFLDPTHKINFMVGEPAGGSIAIDFIGRLFIGYGIYQFIAAFRRHGRKQG